MDVYCPHIFLINEAIFVFRTTVLSLGLIFAASAASADCSPFPRSNFIGDFTHDQVISYVDQAHSGDWGPYLTALEKNLTRLNDMRMRGEGAVVKVRGEPVRLNQQDLSKFVFTSRQFTSVARCLAEQQEAAKFEEFETAAGQPDTADQKLVSSAYSEGRKATKSAGLATNVENIKDEDLRVQISTQCLNGDTVFVVANLGKSWPRASTFSLFRIAGPNRQMISARKMSIEAGKAKTLRVKKAHNITGHVGLALDPGWYKREFTMDADAKCE